MKLYMTKIILLLGILATQNSFGQTIFGVSADIGKSTYERVHLNGVIKPGKAWGIGVDFHFARVKRFNPMVAIGFSQKKYTYIQTESNAWYYYLPPQATEERTIKGAYLNLGVRFNILNKKHKVFLEAGMSTTYIVEQRRDYFSDHTSHTIDYLRSGNPYYAGCMYGFGYNYNNRFSISFLMKPALTGYEYYYQETTRLNMKCMNICYFIPVFSNKYKRNRDVE